MAGPLTLTDKNLDAALEREGIILINFWARSYEPSVAFGAHFAAAAAKHPDLFFGRLDVEKEAEVAEEFEIDFVPTLIVIRDGVMVVRDEEGLDGEEELEELIEGVRGLDMDFVRADIAAIEKKAAAKAAKKPAKRPAAKARAKPAAKKKKTPVAKAKTKTKPARR